MEMEVKKLTYIFIEPFQFQNERSVLSLKIAAILSFRSYLERRDVLFLCFHKSILFSYIDIKINMN